MTESWEIICDDGFIDLKIRRSGLRWQRSRLFPKKCENRIFWTTRFVQISTKKFVGRGEHSTSSSVWAWISVFLGNSSVWELGLSLVHRSPSGEIPGCLRIVFNWFAASRASDNKNGYKAGFLKCWSLSTYKKLVMDLDSHTYLLYWWFNSIVNFGLDCRSQNLSR